LPFVFDIKNVQRNDFCAIDRRKLRAAGAKLRAAGAMLRAAGAKLRAAGAILRCPCGCHRLQLGIGSGKAKQITSQRRLYDTIFARILGSTPRPFQLEVQCFNKMGQPLEGLALNHGIEPRAARAVGLDGAN